MSSAANPVLLSHTSSYNWDHVWIVGSAFVIGFFTAFTMGANDVANSFGTAVGSRILSLRSACILAILFETSGAILLGTYMTSWKDTVDLSVYRGNERVLLFAELSSLVGTALVLLIATLLKIPVSGTHAMVGATVGFTLVKVGPQGVYWIRLCRIVLSWFVSPLLAGVFSGALFVIINRFIISTDNPMERGLTAMPFLYGITIFINFSSLFLDGQLMPGVVEKIPWWGTLIISTGLGLVTAIIVHFFLVPWQRKKIEDLLAEARAREFASHRPRIRSLLMTDIEAYCSTMELADEPSTASEAATDSNATNNSLAHSWSRQRLSRRSASYKRQRHRYKAPKRSLRSISAFEREEFMAEMGVLDSNDGAVTPTEFSPPSRPGQTTDSDSPSIASGGISIIIPKAVSNPGTSTPTIGVISPATIDERIEVLSVEDGMGSVGQNDFKQYVSEFDLPVTTASRSSLTEPPVPESQCDESRPKRNTRRHTISLSCCNNPALCRGKRESIPQRRSSVQHDQPEIAPIFSYLQIVTAAFIAFAHGGNDVCNAVGPLVEIWAIFTHDRSEAQPNIWLLCFGGVGISAGLCFLGRRVIETIGTTLSPVLPSSGFCIGLGTASTVMIASKIGLPVSTTHCIVGSVIIVGMLQCRKEVNLKLFGWIAGGWLITLPLSAAFGAAVMAILVYSA